MHSLSLPLTITILIFSLLITTTSTVSATVSLACPSFSCNKHRHDTVQFPFRVPLNQTRHRCGYPGFDLSCTSDGGTLLRLPNGPPGPFVVRDIDYADQIIWVSDPNKCAPKRVLEMNLTGSPYGFGPDSFEYSFLNCSRPGFDPGNVPRGSSVVSCLSGGNYTVVAAFERANADKIVRQWKCKVIKRVTAPLWWPELGYGYYPSDVSDVFLQLSWDVPACGSCALQGGSCGFIADSDLAVGCFVSSSSGGLPLGAKYGLILGAGIPGLICMVGLTFYISGRIRAYNQNRRRASTEFSPAIFPQSFIVTMGLDRPTIESYPKTILGESKRLPKPSDGTCPICLADYEPKDTLRSIPECNHYFHAECIDEWLRLNATCPLCRNSPQKSSAAAGR